MSIIANNPSKAIEGRPFTLLPAARIVCEFLMKNRNYWLLFVSVQAAGTLLSLLTKSLPNSVSLVSSLLLLLPGDLVASIAGKISPYLFFPLVFVINAGAWLLVKKILPNPGSPS